MALVQRLPSWLVQLIQAEGDGLLQVRAGGGGFLYARQHGGPVSVPGALAENAALQVAGQADSGREHDVPARPGRIEPRHPAVRQQGQVDHSSTRMRSRSSAASSKFSLSTARRSWSLSSSSLRRGSAPAPGGSYRSPTCWLEPCNRRNRSRRWASKES